MSLNDLTEYTDEQLLAEVNRRKDLKTKARFAAINQNLNFINLIRQSSLENLSWIKHTCSNCTDENPANHYLDNGAIRCIRCYVIVMRNNSDYLDENLEVKLGISMRY